MVTQVRILLIDDDVDFVAINRALLEHHGYQVISAFGGREGLETARRDHPDLVILDVMMEGVTEGFDLSREFRQDPEVSGVPILMLTSVNRHFRPLAFAPNDEWLPVDALLDKPVEPSVLLREIERLLASRKDAAN